ncbi:MAG: O-antigen ligase family protein [Deltaproteobacteria bacterium]|nr:O-antigen ligase family protein [Deltaproteobacteria bacterium]
MTILHKIDAISARYRLVEAFLLIFLFFQPLSPFTSVREIAFVAMCVFFGVRAALGRVRLDARDPALIALALLVAAAILSSALSPYPLESFDAMRKSLFYQVMTFLVVVTSFRTIEELRPLVYALIGSFAALSAVILIQNDAGVLLDWHVWHSRTGRRETYLLSYSTYAAFYMPLGLAWLYGAKDRMSVKLVLAAFLSLEFALVFLNNHRTQLVAVAASAVLVTALARRWRTLAVVAAALIIAGLAVYLIDPYHFARYRTLAAYNTYATNEGLTERPAIWKGTLDMIKERPVLGYGYGWKKLATAARDGGWLERWDKTGRTYWYFSTFGHGAANPHNLGLQIVFEVGILGFIAYLTFWAAVIIKGARAWAVNSAEAVFLRYAMPGVLLSYVLVNATGGFWEEAMGNLVLSFAAICCVLYRGRTEAGRKDSPATGKDF